MNMKMIPAIAGAALLLSGCAGFQGFTVHSSNCSGGKCVTTNATVGAVPSGHVSGPADRNTPTDTPTATATAISPTASIPGASAPAPDPTAAVTTCLGPAPSQDTLVSLTVYNSSKAQDLATCLAIPPQEMDLFLHLLYAWATQANSNGQFSSDQGRTQVADQLAPVAQKCHAGEAS